MKCKDGFEKGSMVFNQLCRKEEEREWVEGIRVGRNMVKEKGMEGFNGGEI